LWSAIRDDIIQNVFGNVCGSQARKATRLSFHDAGTYNRKDNTGGPNGSIMKFPVEANQPVNNFLQPIIVALKAVRDKWDAKYPGKVSHADIIQLGGVLGTVICPDGPQVKFDVGRPDANSPDNANNLPTVDQSVDEFLDIFARMGLSVTDFIALIGAHTTAVRHDGPTPGLPLDTTVAVWDTLFYAQTLQPQVPAGTQRMPSDEKLSTDARTRPLFQRFVDEERWEDAFRKGMRRMANLGQHGLVNCPIVPPETPAPNPTGPQRERRGFEEL
jgi:hypothetical protein